MAKALFSLHSKSGTIRRNKNGNYKLILNNLDSDHLWFTNRPDRAQGSISSEEVVEGWSSYFSDSSPNSVVSFTDSNGKFGRFIFEQSKPKLGKNGLRFKSRIIPLDNEGNDKVTGLGLKRGEFIKMNDPSVIVDDYTLSSIRFTNNTDSKLRLNYTIGEIKQGADWNVAELNPGDTRSISGTTHDKWDISVKVQEYFNYQWLTGITVQADNPWYGKPQFEYNESGSYMTSRKWHGIDGSEWGITESPKTFNFLNSPDENADWILEINPG